MTNCTNLALLTQAWVVVALWSPWVFFFTKQSLRKNKMSHTWWWLAISFIQELKHRKNCKSYPVCMAGQTWISVMKSWSNVSGSECIGRCGQLPLKGSASSDLASVCEDCCNKKLDSNCVLVLLFQQQILRRQRCLTPSPSLHGKIHFDYWDHSLYLSFFGGWDLSPKSNPKLG